MRIFSIKYDGKFEEFSQIPFQINHEESILESWLESNPENILEDGKLLIIGRQVSTNLGGLIDLLGIDREGNTVVIELKRDKTPRDTLAQALEYASFIEALDSKQLEEILQNYLNDESLNLAVYHNNYFELFQDEAISFNKNQRIVIVGQQITNEIRQTAHYLRNKGLQVTCIEFSYFKNGGGRYLLSYDIVVGKEPKKAKKISSSSLPITDHDSFLKSLDENGFEVFRKMLEFAENNSLPIHWGVKGFSMNINKNGVHIAICYGYPPTSVYKQSIYTAFFSQGGLLSKLNISEQDVKPLREEALNSGLFQNAGRELKIMLNREIRFIINWLGKMTRTINNHSLK